MNRSFNHYWPSCTNSDPQTCPSLNEQPKADSVDAAKEPAFLEIVDNKIYFYAEIERDKVLTLNKKIEELNVSLLNTARTYKTIPANIYLYINSYGGNIFSGYAAMDIIEQSEVPIITIVNGVCASAATLLSIVGKERMITRNSYMMIHQISAFMWGKYEAFKDKMKNLDAFMNRIKTIYKKHTVIPSDVLDGILTHDLFFDAEQCLEYKLVDKII